MYTHKEELHEAKQNSKTDKMLLHSQQLRKAYKNCHQNVKR